MNFLRPLLCCAAALSLVAQVELPQARGGGTLQIGATVYRLRVTGLATAAAKGGLPGAVRLEGDLVPTDGSTPFHMVLAILKTGTLYTLRMERRHGKAYPDSWAATVKTKVRALRLEDRPGGRVELQCEGPLRGILAQRPVEAAWSGTLWAEFPD